MPDITLTVEVGRPTGSPSTRRLRAAGQIPGVVYGHGMDPVPVAVGARELRAALSGESGLNALLSLQANGEEYLTVARELQRDPVRGTVTHVDFQIVRRDEVISAEVPVSLTGEAIEVQHGDGLVEQQLFTLVVRALPSDIPTGVEVDISELVIGGAVRVSDLVLPPGVSAEVDPEVTVVVGQPPRVQLIEEAAPEAGVGEGVAPAEAAGEAGAPAGAPGAESGEG